MGFSFHRDFFSLRCNHSIHNGFSGILGTIVYKVCFSCLIYLFIYFSKTKLSRWENSSGSCAWPTLDAPNFLFGAFFLPHQYFILWVFQYVFFCIDVLYSCFWLVLSFFFSWPWFFFLSIVNTFDLFIPFDSWYLWFFFFFFFSKIFPFAPKPFINQLIGNVFVWLYQ